MTSLLGMHWIRTHQNNTPDFAHIEAMQYPSIKLFGPSWDNRDFCNGLLSVLPKDSCILDRDHPLSEQKDDMWRDPEGTGNRHADEWADKVRRGKVYTPVDRTFFLGINEPDATDGDRDKIDRYTEAFLRRLAQHGLRGGAFNFSTGHPRTVDGTPNTPADYSVFERSHRAIVEGNHIAVLHIYGTGAVPCVAGHYDRLTACTWQDVEWIVGEFGVDEHVIGGGPHVGFHGYFNGRLNDYCGWLDAAIMGINDPRIHSYQVFSYDFSHPWGSFDVQVIRDALQSYDWQHVKMTPPDEPDDKPYQTHLPYVSVNPHQTAYVVVPSGANIRTAPDVETGDIVEVVPYGDAVTVSGFDKGSDGAQWARVQYFDRGGWMRSDLLNTEPGDTSQGDNWSLAYPEVLRFEGDLSLDPNDPGNWYNGQLVGTKYGISAAVWGGQYDIPNLTKEQALEIYRKHYWEASGADQLSWPMSLIVFDTAVNHGVGVARQLLASQPTQEEVYLGQRGLRYFDDPNWTRYGVAWGNRVNRLHEIAKGD